MKESTIQNNMKESTIQNKNYQNFYFRNVVYVFIKPF